MAFLWKHPQSQYWIARFFDKEGQRRNRSTRVVNREGNRKQAQKIADTYEEAARNKRTAVQTRKVIASLHEQITGESIRSVSFRAFADEWLAAKRPETAVSTAKFYANAIAKFYAALGPKADAELMDIDKNDILTFRSNEVKLFEPKTVNHDLKVVRMVLRAARSEGLISEDPAEFVKTVKLTQPTNARRPFTIPELKAVLGVADAEWTSMILFGLYTGQRLADVATLTWANVDITAGEIRLMTKKTGKRIIFPLAGPLREHVASLASSDDLSTPVHPRAHDLVVRQGKSGNLSNQFADLLAQAGLREKQAHRKTHGEGRGLGSAKTGLSYHSLRHTAVSLLKEAGIPAAVVMELVGHDSKAMSDHYTHIGTESLRKASEAFPDISSLPEVLTAHAK